MMGNQLESKQQQTEKKRRRQIFKVTDSAHSSHRHLEKPYEQKVKMARYKHLSSALLAQV
jgi:hypothetical protein